MERNNNRRGAEITAIIMMSLILLAVLPSCRKVPLPDEKVLKDAIIRFDKGLIETFMTLKSEPLWNVASENEVGRNDSLLVEYLKKKKYMESEVLEIRIEEIKEAKGKSAEVIALEKWRWRDVDINTKKEIKPWAEEEFNIHYKMVKDKKLGWIVDSTKIISRKKLN